jgi:hypothetical protein
LLIPLKRESGIMLRQEVTDDRFGLLVSALADMAVANASSFVCQYRGGPRPDPVTLPDLVAIVLHDGISNTQIFRGRLHFAKRLFPKKFRRMDSDDRQTRSRISFMPVAQLRDNVPAIDSAIGPEFDDYDPSAQIFESQRGAVDPRPAGKLGGRLSDSERVAYARPQGPSQDGGAKNHPEHPFTFHWLPNFLHI